MAQRMLIDATHPEEIRVAVVSGNRLDDLDYETSTKKQLKGNIYLAKVVRVEPSLQACFVDYGGNRHGFLAFSEIHPDYYRIPIADREALLAEHAAAAAEDYDDEPQGHDRGNGNGRERDLPMPDAPLSDRHDQDRQAGGEPGVNETLADTGATTTPLSEPEFGGEPPPPAQPYREPGQQPPDYAAQPDAAPASEQPAPLGDAAGDPAALDIPPMETAAPAPRPETMGGDATDEMPRRRSRPMRNYKIQEVIKRRQIMLVQVVKEERGNKGAALTTYLSLAGRYCVLMPNTTRGGGVSRKITSAQDRRRLKSLLEDLNLPQGMGVIVRTAGSERSKPEVKRDCDYLLKLWDEIREMTLKSTAPCLIYEEASLIKRAIRDLYARDIDEIWVEGEEGYRAAKDFMKILMPSHAKRVQKYEDPIPLFHRNQIESQIDAIHNPVVQLRSGGYIVINPTEALVAIDVNSGRATRERFIEETALRTNMEAAEEVARQLRLRDLGGLVVVDFIDMEDHRNNHAVERRMKDALRFDRARIQVGRISAFGLLEMSRQRLRPSITETSTMPCPHCAGTGHIRSTESAALHVIRALEDEGIRHRSREVVVHVATPVALYILNQKRARLAEVEQRYGFSAMVMDDPTLIPPDFRLERVRAADAPEPMAPVRAESVVLPPYEEPETPQPDAGTPQVGPGVPVQLDAGVAPQPDFDQPRRDERPDDRFDDRQGGPREHRPFHPGELRDGEHRGGRHRRRRRRGGRGGEDRGPQPMHAQPNGGPHPGGPRQGGPDRFADQPGGGQPYHPRENLAPDSLAPADGNAAPQGADQGMAPGMDRGGQPAPGGGPGYGHGGPEGEGEHRRRRRGRRGGRRRRRGRDGQPMHDGGDQQPMHGGPMEDRPNQGDPHWPRDRNDRQPDGPREQVWSPRPDLHAGPAEPPPAPEPREQAWSPRPDLHAAPPPTPEPRRESPRQPAAEEPKPAAKPRTPSSSAPANVVVVDEGAAPEGAKRGGWWKRLTKS